MLSFSVVINTYNRAASLRNTLEGLRRLTYPQFEIVAVNGPSTDQTAQVLRDYATSIKTADCAERNLAVSRNIGICAAAGDIVAFIDDDAIPEAEWLDQLALGYDADDIGGVGGIVFDQTGYSYQYQYSSANRLGNANWKLTSAVESLNFPKSLHFPYLQGTNASFRRTALLEIGGFDEEYEYYLDETDVCVRLIDAGYIVRQMPNAYVHHKFLPSNIRDENRVATYRYPVIKNKIYFSLRHGRDHFSMQEIVRDNVGFVDAHLADVDSHIAGGRLPPEARSAMQHDAERAWMHGLERGIENRPKLMSSSRVAVSPVPFKPVNPILQAGRRLTICLLCQDFPPDHAGGIARFTHDLAKAFAVIGHQVHVLTRGVGHNRVDFEEGAWVHRLVPIRHVPSPLLDGVRIPQHLWDYSATMRDELRRIATYRTVDVVEAPIWDTEGIATLLDGQFDVVTSLQTPLVIALDNQPQWRADPEFMRSFVDPQLIVERYMLRNSTMIRSISESVTATMEKRYNVNLRDGRTVLAYLGLADRCPATAATDAKRRSVNVLFVGRLEKRKGIQALLEAAPRVLASHPEVTITIAGDDTLPAEGGGTYRQRFEQAHVALVESKRIRFVGRVDDTALYELYAACDVFVAPSRYESFGLTLIEAMMFGKPVIACSTGGALETVVEGGTGLLVAPDDDRALSTAIVSLVENELLRERLGRAGRLRYEAHFTDVAMAKRSIEMYSRVRTRSVIERGLASPGKKTFANAALASQT